MSQVVTCCHACADGELVGGLPASMTRMILCPLCGNKRCPKANNHAFACTSSNEEGQPGSAYPTLDEAEATEARRAIRLEIMKETIDLTGIDPTWAAVDVLDAIVDRYREKYPEATLEEASEYAADVVGSGFLR